MQKREGRDEFAVKEQGGQESKPVWLFLQRVVFYGLLLIIALSAVPYGTVEPWWIALFECAIFLLGAIWFLTGLAKSDWRLPAASLLWPLFALLLFVVLQTIDFGGNRGTTEIAGALRGTMSADPYETRLVILKLLALILTFILLLRHAISHRRLRALIYVVIGICVVSALFGILRQTTHRNSMGFLLPYLKPDSGYGQFINRNHFAFLMEMGFGLVLGLLIGGGISRDRLLLYLSLAMPIWFALILSNSRGGIFSMLGQLIFAALLFTLVRAPREKTSRGREESGWLRYVKNSVVTRVLLIVCLVIAVAFSVVWIGGDQLASRIEMGQAAPSAEKIESRQGESRSEVWRATWALVKDNPLAGVGFGGYWAVIPKYHDASGELTPQQAHNDYLEILASGGLIGTALCAWLVFVLLKQACVQLRSTDSFRRAACFG
ncbi:MAG TPA: O-antigen ligase family protein, partial [Pyrinomonadaceae bacterium]|nr:O-antigen ligase family protein [Pyrinomonadaceae bacterium]